MGIDLKAGGRAKLRNRESKSTNLYLRLLIRLYKFLARRTDSRFNKVVLRRLNQSKIQRYPIGVSRIVKNIKSQPNKIAVVVSSVLDDKRVLDLPKMTVCALRFSESARKRILAAGGTVLTFDQLALKAPTGANTLLLRGPKSREALKHFGRAPGLPGSHTKPYCSSKRRHHGPGLR